MPPKKSAASIRAAKASTTRKPAAKKATKRAVPRKAAPVRKTTPRKAIPKKSSSPIQVIAPWDELSRVANSPVTPLTVPWGLNSYVTSLGGVKVGKNYFYPGTSLPPSLAPFASPDFSWIRYISDKASGSTVDTAPPATYDTGKYTLRADQEIDRDTIVHAYANGAPEFLIASLTGVGKTVVAVSAAMAMPDIRRVLVFCPAPVQNVWRQHLRDMGTGGMDWVVINYESNKNLLKPDATSLNAKKTATKNKNLALNGTPWEEFDLIITDESHMTSNPTAQQSRVVEKMIDLSPNVKSLRMTATPGKDPSKLYYLRRGLAYSTGTPVFDVSKSFTPYVDWARQHGIESLGPAPFGNGIMWDGDESELDAMNRIIFSPSGGRTWALRSEPHGWPEQLRSAFPVQLSADERAMYESEWGEFQKAMKGLNSNTDRKAKEKGLAAQTRYRQKVGQLKVPYVVDHAAMLVKGGQQVMISAIYKGTVNALQEAFEAKGIPVAIFTGSNQSTRESERIDFQQGRKKVIIFSTTVGISLHAGEDSTNATDVPRSLIVAEPQWSAIAADQTEGRGTRNAQHAHAYYPYALDTNDEKVVKVMTRGLATMNKMAGSDISLIEDLGDAFGFKLFSDS